MWLRLVRGDPSYDAATVFTLCGESIDASGSYDTHIKAATYNVRMPENEYTRTSRAGIDGDTITRMRRGNITETVDVIFDGGPSNFQNFFRNLQDWLTDVEKRREGRLGDRVYIEYIPFRDTGSNSTAYRSELLAADIEMNDPLPTRPFRDGRGTISIIWEREPFWETAEEYVGLKNTTGGNYTGGDILVQSTYEGGSGDSNRAFISRPAGFAYPAPLKLTIQNTTSKSLIRVYVSANMRSGSPDFEHILEAEDRDFAIGTTVSDASASSGEYLHVTWSTSTAYDSQILCAWNLASAFSENAGGNRFRILGSFFERPSSEDYQVQIVAQTAGALDLLTTPWVDLESGRFIQDFGTIQWPPRLIRQTNIADIRFGLNIRAAQTGSLGVKLDFIQFSPLDSFRKYYVVHDAISTGETIVDDPNDGLEPYVETTAGKKSVDLVTFGGPIVLEPEENDAGSEDQALYFLYEQNTGETYGVTMATAVQADIRQRYTYPY